MKLNAESAATRAFSAIAIRAGMKYTIKNGYKTFNAFKKAYGTKKNYQWHHIVEQSNVSKTSKFFKKDWDARAIHNPQNLIQIPKDVHQKCINSWMNKKNVKLFGLNSGTRTMRDLVNSYSFQKQHEIGVKLLRHCGVQF